MTKNFIHSETFKKIIISLIIAIAVLVVFRVGMVVGFRQASFSYQWGENYYHNFAGPRPGILGEFAPGHEFMESHGAFGTIIKIDPSDLVVRDQFGSEEIINVSSSTVMRNHQNLVTLKDLKLDDGIVVIGEPAASGTIEASLIRVLPPLPSNPSK